MLSLRKAFDLFICSRETFCRDRTVANYGNTVRYFVEYMVAQCGVPAEEIDITIVDIHVLNDYSIYLKNKRKHDNNPNFKIKSDTKISTRTRKDYLKDVATFFNFLYENEYIEKNPTEKLRFPKTAKKVIEPLTNDEVHIIDDCYNINTQFGCRNLAIIHCLLDEGMRSGEVQRLKLSDLHFDGDYIVIRNSKGGKNRILPMARIVKKYLQRYISDHRPDAPHEYVFCTNAGAPLTPESIKCFFDRLKKTSGVRRLYPHLLRHTYGTSFILGGGSVELLRIYMGHEDINTTQNYLHVANNLRFCTNVYRLDTCFLKKFY